MLVVPLERAGRPIGALSILDRRDGRAYRNDDLEPAGLFADLAVKALDVTPNSFTSLGMTRLGHYPRRLRPFGHHCWRPH